jgi:hypothetical protein
MYNIDCSIDLLEYDQWLITNTIIGTLSIAKNLVVVGRFILISNIFLSVVLFYLFIL